MKDPYILEFLGFDEKAEYSESELEQRLIDKLEHYIKPEQHSMRSKPGQPIDQLLFHRPLSVLFDAFLRLD